MICASVRIGRPEMMTPNVDMVRGVCGRDLMVRSCAHVNRGIGMVRGGGEGLRRSGESLVGCLKLREFSGPKLHPTSRGTDDCMKV